MRIGGGVFCQRLKQASLPFELMAMLFVAVKEESHGKAVISANTQAVIYESLPDLLPEFAGEGTPLDWILPIPPLALNDWLVGLSLFEPGSEREALLKDTAILLRQLPHAA